MKPFNIFVVTCFIALKLQGQFSIHGTYDTYLASSLSQKDNLAFMVSHAALNQMDLNLFELEFRQEFKHLNLHFAPAMGSYMRCNYAQETFWRRNVYEAYAELKFQDAKLAFGSFSSPYTQETPRGVDQLLYSRSLSAEYVPYYVAGLRYSQQFSEKFSAQLFLTNGWQRLHFTQVRPSIGALLQWKFDTWSLNWSHFYGDIAPRGKLTATAALDRWRYFQEFNAGFKKGNYEWQACAYVGLQRSQDDSTLILYANRYWGQVNLQVRRSFENNWSLNSRIESFVDPKQVVSQFSSPYFCSFSLGYIKQFGPVLQLGQEMRYFFGKEAQIPLLYTFLRLKF
jgi:hypothetical protein